jgi:hypothetical protein
MASCPAHHHKRVALNGFLCVFNKVNKVIVIVVLCFYGEEGQHLRRCRTLDILDVNFKFVKRHVL